MTAKITQGRQRAGFLSQIKRGIRKIRSSVSVLGFAPTLKMTIHNIFSVELFYRMEKRLFTPEYKLTAKIPLTIKEMRGEMTLAPEDIKKVTGIRGKYGIEQFEERLAGGESMFGAYHEGELAAFVWIEYPPVSSAGCIVPDNMAFTYDAWTFDEFRGKRIFPVIQQRIFQHLRSHHPDITQVLTQVAAWNKSSSCADQSAGYIITGIELSVIFCGYNRRLRIS